MKNNDREYLIALISNSISIVRSATYLFIETFDLASADTEPSPQGACVETPDLDAGLGREVTLPQRLRKPLDGIAEHRARHALRVTPQELFLDRAVALADFSEHPAHSLVNEIVRIIEQEPRDTESRVKLTALDVLEGRHDGDASFPQQTRFGHPPQSASVTVVQVRADDVLCRAVDQIPIVDPKRTTHVETINRVTTRGVSASVLPNQNEQREKSLLVPARFQQRGDVAQRNRLVLASELAKDRDADAEESITSSVLTGPRLEKALKHSCVRQATKGLHAAMNGRRCDGVRNTLWHSGIALAVTRWLASNRFIIGCRDRT